MRRRGWLWQQSGGPTPCQPHLRLTPLTPRTLQIPAASINFFFMPLQFQVGPCNACAPCLQVHARSLVQGRSTLRLPGARRTQGSARPSGTMRRLHTLPPPHPTMTPHQVLYMSTCGMLWTAYLSYSSARKQ